MPIQFTVATANTQFDRLVNDDNGFNTLLDADILLLQEVSDPGRDDLIGKLRQANFQLVHCVGKLGLAIALRNGSKLHVVPGSERTYEYAQFNLLEKFLIAIAASGRHEFNRRGIIALKLQTANGHQITIATTHPAIDMTPKSRVKQLAKLGKELGTTYYNGTLILGGDMNHHPGPKAADILLRKDVGLQIVDLGNRPTWVTRKSKLFLASRIVDMFNGKRPEDHDGQLDDILYRGDGISPVEVNVVDIPSDHNAVKATFSLKE